MIAVAGGKGGCGKSTTALGIARELAGDGHTPLVVDADVDMPDLGQSAGVDDRGGTDRLAAGASVRDAAVRPPDFPGIRLLTAGGRRRLPAALAAAHAYSDTVVLDTPAGLSPGVTRPLAQADRVLLVTTTTAAALADTRSTQTLARRLDTPPAGTLVREVPAESTSAGSLAGLEVLARVPTVESPFESPAVRAGWQTVADAVV